LALFRCSTSGALPQSAGGVRFAVPLSKEPAAVRLPVCGLNHSPLSGDFAPAISSVNGAGAFWNVMYSRPGLARHQPALTSLSDGCRSQ
jgi:hypothetical protein